jgi:hypothetical protein
MNREGDSQDTVIDFITGQDLPNAGAEENRQRFERFLVQERGFRPSDIHVDAALTFEIRGEVYRSTIDLLVSLPGGHLMAIKCAAGSLDSREKEIVSAARLVAPDPAPLAVATDGRTALVWDTQNARRIGAELESIPSREEGTEWLKSRARIILSPDQMEREKLIFRSYDSMNVNRPR